MSGKIKPGTHIKGLHIDLLDDTLMKAYKTNGCKPVKVYIKEADNDDDSHFSVDVEVLGVQELMPPSDDVVELDKLSAFELHFDYDLSTYLERSVLVITSTATRLFNALFVPFSEVECVVEPFGGDWKIALTSIVERESDSDTADFEEIKY